MTVSPRLRISGERRGIGRAQLLVKSERREILRQLCGKPLRYIGLIDIAGENMRLHIFDRGVIFDRREIRGPAMNGRRCVRDATGMLQKSQ